jgi:hypothetical protein
MLHDIENKHITLDDRTLLETAVATPLMLRYTLLRKALSTNGVVSSLV